MVKRQKWVDHVFCTNIDIGWTENVLVRLRDTEIRLVHYTADLSDRELSNVGSSHWNIKEHIGHLTDLESLWVNRLEQFASKTEVLVAADMSNKKTNAANHNDQMISDLLNEFSKRRAQTIQYFESLEDEIQQHTAKHPRLNVLMRPVDLLFFIAEHDDHHIVSIRDIIRNK